MNPLVLSSLLSMAPGILGKLGIFGKDPQREMQRRVAQLTSARNVGAQTNQFYNQFLQSPAYAAAQGGIANAGNQAANALASSLGSRGLSSTGIGSTAKALTSSLPGIQMGQLQTQGYQNAQQQAMQAIQAQIAALSGAPSQNTQLFAGGLGALGSMLPFLLQKRVPGVGNGLNPGWSGDPWSPVPTR